MSTDTHEIIVQTNFDAFKAAWKRVGLPGRPVRKGKHAAVTAWGWRLVYDPAGATRVLRTFPKAKRASGSVQERIAEALSAAQVVVGSRDLGKGAASGGALYVTDEDPTPFTMAEFLDANKGDGALDPEQLAAIRALKPGESVTLGFGAGGESTITRVNDRGRTMSKKTKKTAKRRVTSGLARYQALVANPGKLTATEKQTLARLAQKYHGQELAGPKVHLGHNLAILKPADLAQKLQKENRKIAETTGAERKRHRAHKAAIEREVRRRVDMAIGNPKRGQRITTPGGGKGRFVGRRAGVDWIAYNPGDYATMVKAFDARRRPKAGKPGAICAHCNKPIKGIPVSHHSEGKPSMHYHPAHAKHHKA